jgi:RHS repeat-associated protein
VETLVYDEENRLTSVSGAATASFVYDGDGNRVKSVVGATTTYFVGSHYETSGGVVTRYYLAGGTRVAIRTGSAFYWLLSDHLGSTSKVATSTGALHSQQLYKAWGESRYTSGTLPTRYTYTGQYSYANDFGLVFYGSRFYDPLLARWTSPDSIIPQGQGTLAWDRYSYVNNSPLNYTDPTGHFLESFLDIASIAYDIYDISQNGLNWGSGLSLAADVVSLILPGVTGGGMAVRALSKVDDVGNAANIIDNTLDIANTSEILAEALHAVDNLPNKPYSNPWSRPSYGTNQVETVWGNAKQIDGNVYDPFTGEQLFWDKSKPRNGQWDMGHTPDHQYQDLWKKYMNDDINYDEFLRQYRDSDNYFPQSINSNRSRRYDPR